MEPTDPHYASIAELHRDRRLAHRVLFKHRHPDRTPEFIDRLIDRWYSPVPYALSKVFRGGAKSTTAEEAFVVMAAFREFKYALVLGDSADRACERLAAIKHEMETNDRAIELFGEMRGATWTDDVIVTASGIMIRALGRGQAILGIKHREMRPDFFFADDIEDRESVRTEKGREAAHRWLMADVIPACDPRHRGRIAATPRDPDDIPARIERESSKRNAVWAVDNFPIEYIDGGGERRATWPDRYPLAWIDARKADMEAQGRGHEWRMEYMLDCSAPEDKAFNASMIRVEPRPLTWQAVYTMHDPARTVRATSADTGFAAWSWIGPKLVVWDAWARKLMPDEIVDSLFTVAEQLQPVLMGIEEDGLNEWLMQPVRLEQARRRIMLPVKPMKAPRGKIDFIRGLQIYFNAREIEFAKELPDLKSQLLAFPTGRIDAPNALAYALRMRPGAPVYENFSIANIADDLSVVRSAPAYLVLNATRTLLTAVLMQFTEGQLRIVADWVREGEPADTLLDVVQDANIEAEKVVRLVAGPLHFDRYNNVGLVQAGQRIPLEVRKGIDPAKGREQLKAMLRRMTRALPVVQVSDKARWTLNALAGGYCFGAAAHGRLNEFAEEGVHRVLMEGIESYAGLMGNSLSDEEDRNINWATSADGRRYISARVQR